MWWEQVSAPHFNSRDITHTLGLPHQWGGTVSTAADTDNHTQTTTHTTILITPLGHTPSLQFIPLLTTTTLTPAPLGRRSVGEMVVMVSPALPDQPAHQDLQGYLVPLVHPA